MQQLSQKLQVSIWLIFFITLLLLPWIASAATQDSPLEEEVEYYGPPFPKAACEEGEGEIGDITEAILGISNDGKHIAVFVDFLPYNWICGIWNTTVEVREIESGKVLWSSPFKGEENLSFGGIAPSLQKSLPREIITQFGLEEPVCAAVQYLNQTHSTYDLTITGRRNDKSFELYFPFVPDSFQNAWICNDNLIMVFSLYQELENGSILSNQLLIPFPITTGLNKAEYENLRERTRTTSVNGALKIIADKTYRNAKNTFAALALAYEVLSRTSVNSAPEQYMAVVSEITFYDARQKELGFANGAYLAQETLDNPDLKGPRFTKFRKMIEFNLLECQKFKYIVPGANSNIVLE